MCIIISDIDIVTNITFDVKRNIGFRGWYYFRQGWSVYFAFIFAAINTLTVTYFLAIENYPVLKEVFPRKSILLISSENFANKTTETLSRIFDFLEIPNQEITDLTKQNTIAYPKMNNSTRDFLVDYFKPYNEKLFELLGERFDWQN